MLLEQGDIARFNDIMNETQNKKWSAHSSFVLCLTIHPWLIKKAKLETFSFVFENTGFVSPFLRGTDDRASTGVELKAAAETSTTSTPTRRSSVFNHSIHDYAIHKAIDSI